MPTTPPATQPLRERQRNALRAEIERAAIRLFAEQGFDQVTTEAIAEAVGISPSTFFRHVPNKDQLLLAATQRGRAQIVGDIPGPLGGRRSRRVARRRDPDPHRAVRGRRRRR